MECLRDKFVGGVLLDGGRFQTLSPLNHGSFGMVFMAQDLASNQPVAIKCLTKNAGQIDACQEFAVDERSEEMVLHSAISPHDNIVNLIHSFETDSHIYLVLEFCGQGDLYEAIRNGHGPLQTEHVRHFMLELVGAVEYIHSKGIYHRDIKPENIFLTQDGAMKLGDFGLATTDKWSYEMTVGSDRYMAPEQFDSAGAGYSPAEADIWAIGICLLNILFSRNPFTTPTEADPLFLDYSRDKQSLFDVFPSMSQDTYEVIVQCMNMDPRRRSLVGAKEALLRVVSFTTADESLDDFCGAEKATVASANREPLRTPSVQTAQFEFGAFPWTRALHATPQRAGRQLSAIPDNESYTEDLFSKSENTVDWCSAAAQTPSISSTLESHLMPAMKTLTIHPPKRRNISPAAGSLPIAMAKPLTLSMSSVFGRRDPVSKSWSDMWDEDEEEEVEQQRGALKALNSRTWSHESVRDADKENFEPVPETAQINGDVDGDLVDGFFFHEAILPKPIESVARYSPPPKRTSFDKWAALGERRRGGSTSDDQKPPVLKHRRSLAFGHKSNEVAVWDHSPVRSGIKERAKDSPVNKGKDLNWRRDRRADLGDIEWVGGW
ncbi:kinase-like domain [Cordyceps militaris]|uniref:Autophagy-related protein 1 n=1 Tax=Cordyceps militaris TaxID=73501 RepID=A0A2H4S868_CORMI|nr:kinase-like domain [Cordyceps militaris]